MENDPLAAEILEESRPIVELPIEVEDLILECLDNVEDHDTIAICALVCRQWLPRCRLKLWSFIELGNREHWTRFKSLMSSSSTSPASVGGYLRFVRELHITPAVRNFLSDDATRPRIGWGRGQERPWAHMVLFECAVHLASLTRLTLKNVDWSHFWSSDILRSGCHYSSLTKLEMQYCTFSSVLQIHVFVTAFPSLTDLTLASTKLGSSLVPTVPRLTGGHPLARLGLQDSADVMATLSRWLVNVSLVQTLTRLYWRPLHKDKAAEAWTTLSKAIDGSRLDRLAFYMPDPWQVDLTQFSSLGALLLDYAHENLNEHFSLLKSVLSSVTSRGLEELRISHHFANVYSLDTILAALTHMKDINTILRLPQFSSLRSVKIVFHTQILMQATAITPDTPLPSHVGGMPVVNPQTSSLDPKVAYRYYAEDLVARKFQQELEHLSCRGILETRLLLYPVEQSEDTDTG